LKAECLQKLGRLPEALESSTRAIALAPEAGAYYAQRSSIHLALGDKQRARADAQAAARLGAKLNPDFLKMLNP
jgi:tetratricopeptide (TPR) repeat protein